MDDQSTSGIYSENYHHKTNATCFSLVRHPNQRLPIRKPESRPIIDQRTFYERNRFSVLQVDSDIPGPYCDETHPLNDSQENELSNTAKTARTNNDSNEIADVNSRTNSSDRFQQKARTSERTAELVEIQESRYLEEKSSGQHCSDCNPTNSNHFKDQKRFNENFFIDEADYENDKRNHPLSRFIAPRELSMVRKISTATLPYQLSHVPYNGLRDPKYFESIFNSPEPSEWPTIFDLMNLEDAVAFRHRTKRALEKMKRKEFDYDEGQVTSGNPFHGNISISVPPEHDGMRPVLYQVVTHKSNMCMVLECKDVLVFANDRLDLHLITFDQDAQNIFSSTNGFFAKNIAIKDFVWVYSLAPMSANVEENLNIMGTFEKGHRPKCFWKVEKFVLVPFSNEREPKLAVIIQAQDVMSTISVDSFEPIVVPNSLFDCDREEYSLISITSRRNVTSAVYFSEPSFSKEATAELWQMFGDFPLTLQGTCLPVLRVKPCSNSWKYFLNDKSSEFRNYESQKNSNFRKLTELWIALNAALDACKHLNDDLRRLTVDAHCARIEAYPLTMSFVLPFNRHYEGWQVSKLVEVFVPGRPTWATGKVSSLQIIEEQDELRGKKREKKLVISIAFCNGQEDRIRNAICRDVSGQVGQAQIRIQLLREPTKPNIISEILQRKKLFSGTCTDNILKLFYGRRETCSIVYSPTPITNLYGLQLNKSQKDALRAILGSTQLIGVVGPFGSGKSLITAVASLLLAQEGKTVVIVSSTNFATLQIADIISKLSGNNAKAVRFVSEGAEDESSGGTSVYDLPEVLNRLGQEELSREDRALLTQYIDARRKHQELKERLMNTDLECSSLHKDYFEVDLRLSNLSRSSMKILYSLNQRRPKILISTINSFVKIIERDFLDLRNADVLLVDQSNYVSEIAAVALMTRLPAARHVYFGDEEQLQPHAMLPRDTTPAIQGAQSSLSWILRKSNSVRLTESYRCHPELGMFLNKIFFDDERNYAVHSADAESRRTLLNVFKTTNAEIPFQFVDVENGFTEQHFKHSYSNTYEVECVINMVKHLMLCGLNPSAMGILCIYKNQYKDINEHLKKLKITIEIWTSDTAQSKECDVLFVLTTRTNIFARGEQYNAYWSETEDDERCERKLGTRKVEKKMISFLEDRSRILVALSRGRCGCFVFGQKGALSKINPWKKILHVSEKHNCITTWKSLKDSLQLQEEPSDMPSSSTKQP